MEKSKKQSKLAQEINNEISEIRQTEEEIYELMKNGERAINENGKESYRTTTTADQDRVETLCQDFEDKKSDTLRKINLCDLAKSKFKNKINKWEIPPTIIEASSCTVDCPTKAVQNYKAISHEMFSAFGIKPEVNSSPPNKSARTPPEGEWSKPLSKIIVMDALGIGNYKLLTPLHADTE